MPARAEFRRIIAIWLLPLLVALLVAGCNLNSAGVGAPAQFEGPPVIHIAAPLPNQTYLVGTTVMVQARVENAGPDLARIAVLLDDQLLGEKLNPNETEAAVLPLTIDWPTSNIGQHKISVLAERGDGVSAREDVHILVIGDEGGEAADTAAAETGPTDTGETASETARDDAAQPAATTPPEAAGTGESQVPGTVIQPSNLRLGPGTAYELLGSLPKDEQVLIVAVNPARDWYRISYADLDNAWIYSDLLSPSGDISGVPVETGPQAASEDGVNLVLDELLIADAITCNQPFDVLVRISNKGNAAPLTGAWVSAEAILNSTGESLTGQEQPHNLRILQPGEEEVLTINLTLSLHVGEEQTLRVAVDSGNHVAETDEGDNTGGLPFTLARGNCG